MVRALARAARGVGSRPIGATFFSLVCFRLFMRNILFNNIKCICINVAAYDKNSDCRITYKVIMYGYKKLKNKTLKHAGVHYKYDC